MFIFLFALAIGINAIVKRYIKRSIEEVEGVKEEPNKEQPGKISGKVYCSSCGAEILDKSGDYCSKCGVPLK